MSSTSQRPAPDARRRLRDALRPRLRRRPHPRPGRAEPAHQTERFDRQFLARRQWAYAAWRERRLDHPPVGTLARRLLWTVDGRPCDPTLTHILSTALLLSRDKEIADRTIVSQL
ncbi:DUF4132 domain-containing protein [Streptomyces sp. IBSBF 2435]|uniref:DUF4132 domain-containing protein n=1 Tax=Streptomyces sp. IBSBF 2435 TaxID=2903531 RepID=UPI002FDC100D